MDKLNGFSNFNFVGKLQFPKKKEEFLREKKGEYKAIKFAIKANGSTQYVELFGGNYDELKLKDVNDKEFKVKRSKVTEKVIEKTKGFYKKSIEIEDGEREVFLDDLSLVEAIIKNKDALEGQYVSVWGQVRPNRYNKKTYLKFNPKGIKITTEDEMKPKLEAELPVVFKGSVLAEMPEVDDLADQKGIVPVPCMTQIYDKAMETDVLVDVDGALMNFSWIKEDNARHKILATTILDTFKYVDTGDDEEEVDTEKYYEAVLKLALVRGVDDSKLTGRQKRIIETYEKNGMEDEAKKMKREILGGGSGTELRVVRMVASNMLAEVEIDEENDFFIDDEAETNSKKKKEEKKPAKKPAKKKEEEEEEDVDDLMSSAGVDLGDDDDDDEFDI